MTSGEPADEALRRIAAGLRVGIAPTPEELEAIAVRVSRLMVALDEIVEEAREEAESAERRSQQRARMNAIRLGAYGGKVVALPGSDWTRGK